MPKTPCPPCARSTAGCRYLAVGDGSWEFRTLLDGAPNRMRVPVVGDVRHRTELRGNAGDSAQDAYLKPPRLSGFLERREPFQQYGCARPRRLSPYP